MGLEELVLGEKERPEAIVRSDGCGRELKV
jgi:hypothetical protein